VFLIIQLSSHHKIVEMKKISFIVAAITGMLYLQSCDVKRDSEYSNKTTFDINGLAFIKNTHEGGMTEIAASKIAKQKSTNKQVTDFAEMMINDHTKASKMVDSVADDREVLLHNTISHDHQAMLDSLSKKTGAEFDKAYMEMMVDDHKETVESFNNNKDGNYSDIRDIVRTYLPTIEKHYEEAKKINASLGGK
jgi:putative membrane protein